MNKWTEKLMLIIRIFLAIVFLMYGGAKLAGGQWFYGDWTASKSTVSGTFLVWLFYGYSSFYGHFIALFEVVPAIFILFRRTAAPAAAALFAVSLNITVMDFCYGFPGVKYASAFYTLLCLVVMAYEYKKFLLLAASREETQAAADAVLRFRAEHPGAVQKRLSTSTWILGAVVLIPLAFFGLNLIGTSIDKGPEDAAKAALLERGYKDSDLKPIGTRAHGQSGINRTGEAYFQVVSATPQRTVRVDMIRPTGFSKWRLIKIEEHSEPPAVSRP